MTDQIDMNNHDPRKIREELGIDKNVLLAPQKPQPEIHEGTLLQVLTHHSVFSAADCSKVIADNAEGGWDHSIVQSTATDDSGKSKPEVRNSDNIWLEKKENNLWLFDKMLALTVAANSMFKFEVDYFEALQLVRYEEGQFYDWHSDLGPGMMGNRKLGISVQLSESHTYEGGDLICDDNGREFVAPRDIGSVTVFPSFMKHKVATVTKGTRYSLVVWASGTQRFR